MSTDKKIIFGTLAATLIILVGGILILGKTPGTSAPADASLSDQEKQYLVRDDSHQSKKDGKIAVVEFVDFQCPTCGAMYPIISELKETYKENVNFVFRHFPLASHKNSRVAAAAAEAAAVQSKFWDMEKKLFEGQDEWSESDKPKEIFNKYATELKLDIDKFKSDMDNSEVAARIEKDYKDGVAVGVNATPTYYIDGKKYIGYLTKEDLSESITKALSR